MRFFCLRSMQQMSEDKHGLESVSAWIETKLRVRYLIVLLISLRHVYSQDIHIQPVYCSAHSQHAMVVWIQHRTPFMLWCYFGCLPHLRDLRFLHHQGKEAGKVGCQYVHLFNTTPLRAGTTFSAYLIKGAAIQSKPGDARKFSLRMNSHTTGYRSLAYGSLRASGSGIHLFCAPC